MITPSQYSLIKNNYCIFYNGNCNEYLWWLKFLRPQIEQQFPDLKLWIACKSSQLYLFDRQVVPIENYVKEQFAYTEILTCDMHSHPIDKLVEQSNIVIKSIDFTPIKIKSYSIASNGLLPLKSEQIDKIRKYANQKGYFETENGDLTIGVESEDLIKNALEGKPISLINSAFGEKLYKKAFPHIEIINNCPI